MTTDEILNRKAAIVDAVKAIEALGRHVAALPPVVESGTDPLLDIEPSVLAATAAVAAIPVVTVARPTIALAPPLPTPEPARPSRNRKP